MTRPEAGLTPAERAGDLDRIERALRAAVRDALLRHKRDGDPVAVWRDGRVVWIQPDDIPIPDEPAERSGADGAPASDAVGGTAGAKPADEVSHE
jgi:hypothetical protein